MLPEVGHYALVLAFCLSLLQMFVPAAGALSGRAGWMAAAAPAARAQCLFVLLSFVCLTAAFVADDFSVLYVANNSNTATPLLYKVSGVWGAHEGSLLLWVLMLSGWAAAVSFFSRALPLPFKARLLSVLGGISAGFLLFTLLTSNPFARALPPPLQGRELNPLLQDPGLAIHPPMLYMGYVGFSVAFAFAAVALLSGRMDSAWARWARPWVNCAWLFLTLGIMLGSWWAYYELGWGGWWFWDPVENASFMPWLAGTALIHSLAATEARGAYRMWTAFLAVLTFSLCLLGAFIVRSGVLTSVHAFAVDPERGLYILAFLILVVGGSLFLFALRAPMLRDSAMARPLSREGAILMNNVLLSAALAAVLIGTLYPLFLDALGGGKISVGPPYFNNVFVPLTAPLALLVGFGAYARWKRDSAARLLRRLSPPLALALIAGVLSPFLFGAYSLGAAAGFALAAWVAAATLRHIYDFCRLTNGWRMPTLAFAGMAAAHFGFALFIAGVTAVSAYGHEKDARMSAGDALAFAGYTFHLQEISARRVQNYMTQIAVVNVRVDERTIAVLHPEKRRYVSQESPLTEAAIDAGVWRDVYVSLGEPLGGGAWSVRLQIKPLIRWIWGGAILMALGALLAAAGRRRRT